MGAAFISGWFSRRKSGGEASQAFAEAAALVAEQNEKLYIRINEMTSRITEMTCDLRVMTANFELVTIELKKANASNELLQAEVSKLRIALGLNHEK